MEEDSTLTFFIRRTSALAYILTFLIIGFLGLPQLAGVFQVLQHSDILINTSEYSKKYVLIDSIDIYQDKGVESGSITGYSKELDNYKVQIEMGNYSDAVFGSKRSISDVLGDEDERNDEDDKMVYSRYIWYKKNAKYAYITNENEHSFPVKKFLKRKLYLFPILIISFIINRICRLIMKRYGY